MLRRLALIALIALPAAAQPVVEIDTPMSPPEWALLERELLDANSDSIKAFAKRYMDERGYLLHTPRWGTLDGPDDAIETYHNWTLLHALGADDKVLELFKMGQEGHLRQYADLRTELTPLSENGAYHREFITQSDWFHTGEGWRGFFFWGLSEPDNPLLISRTKRFAEMYMGHDPEAQNYDPDKKIIRSIWNGSYGPMLRKATVYDWVGDPTPGRFHLLHNPERGKLLDLIAWYPRMLAHCEEYLDSAGDNFLNLAATILGVNAYALTGEAKYKDWVVEYLDAWKARAAETGGMIPSNVGLDGTLGGEHDGQWWKGTYGWNFTIFDGELRQFAHRNYFTASSWAGFSNGLLLTGDQSYVDVLRRQMDVLYENKKVENGRTLLPQMYGDPRGYKYNGKPEFYRYGPNRYQDRLTEIYLWSMDRKDLERVPTDRGWVAYLEGNDPEYPTREMRRDFERIREGLERQLNDPTSPDTRLADYLLRVMPARVNTLLELTTGAYLPNGRVWTLHSRLRYFDPERSRAGLPEDVAALVEKMTGDSVTVTLVNLSQVQPKTVVVQAGGYGEHQFTSVSRQGDQRQVDANRLEVRLAPGAGATLQLGQARYVNPPRL